MSPRLKHTAITITALLMLAWAAAVYFNGPDGVWWMPRCWFHHFTGYQCPSCGNTRAVYHIMHGHLVEGLKYNLFLVVSLPYLLLVLFGSLTQSKMSQKVRTVVESSVVMLSFAILFILWWVIRNLIAI